MKSKKTLYIIIVLIIAAAAYLAYSGATQPVDGINGNENIVDETAVMNDESSDLDTTEDEVSDANIQAEARAEDVEETATDQATSELDYEDGDYQAEATYTVPNGTQYALELAVTLEQDVVTDAQVIFDDQESGQTSTDLQEAFYNNYTDEVVGKNLSDIDLSRVGGASLTTEAFNQALGDIRTQAS